MSGYAMRDQLRACVQRRRGTASSWLIDIFRSLNKNYVPRFGEPRITPMFSKHVNMDLMVFGLSAVALMIYAMIRAARSRSIGDSRHHAGLGFGRVFDLPTVPFHPASRSAWRF